MLFIRPDLQKLLGSYTFEDFFALDGEVYRDQQQTGRCTKRVVIGGLPFFIKMHTGCGWQEILKNLLCFKKPITSAAHEYRALEKLPRLGINTTPLAAYGRVGLNPARIKSFVLTESLEDSESLESFVPRFFAEPDTTFKQSIKNAVTNNIADIARNLHTNNLYHRDFYLCHFHIDLPDGEDSLSPENVRLYLMDLHRLTHSRLLSGRYCKKDIAGLYFSILDTPLTKKDWGRFIKQYTKSKTLRDAVHIPGTKFWETVHRRGLRLYQRVTGRGSPLKASCFSADKQENTSTL